MLIYKQGSFRQYLTVLLSLVIHILFQSIKQVIGDSVPFFHRGESLMIFYYALLICIVLGRRNDIMLFSGSDVCFCF